MVFLRGYHGGEKYLGHLRVSLPFWSQGFSFFYFFFFRNLYPHTADREVMRPTISCGINVYFNILSIDTLNRTMILRTCSKGQVGLEGIWFFAFWSCPPQHGLLHLISTYISEVLFLSHCFLPLSKELQKLILNFIIGRLNEGLSSQ